MAISFDRHGVERVRGYFNGDASTAVEVVMVDDTGAVRVLAATETLEIHSCCLSSGVVSGNELHTLFLDANNDNTADDDEIVFATNLSGFSAYGVGVINPAVIGEPGAKPHYEASDGTSHTCCFSGFIRRTA